VKRFVGKPREAENAYRSALELATRAQNQKAREAAIAELIDLLWSEGNDVALTEFASTEDHARRYIPRRDRLIDEVVKPGSGAPYDAVSIGESDGPEERRNEFTALKRDLEKCGQSSVRGAERHGVVRLTIDVRYGEVLQVYGRSKGVPSGVLDCVLKRAGRERFESLAELFARIDLPITLRLPLSRQRCRTLLLVARHRSRSRRRRPGPARRSSRTRTSSPCSRTLRLRHKSRE
jgi:hypothetical protein